MVFFKRLSRSRSRSNSQSYVDNNFDSRHDSKTNSAQYDDQYAHSEPPRDRTVGADEYEHDGVPVSAHSDKGPRIGHDTRGENMYTRRDRPTEVAAQQHQLPSAYSGNAGYRQSQDMPDRTRPGANMSGGGGSNGYDAGALPGSSAKAEASPNLLIEAFNQAVRPFSDKIEGLEHEIADLRAYIASLERQQSEVHAWIDKRGLRPGPLSFVSSLRAKSPTC